MYGVVWLALDQIIPITRIIFLLSFFYIFVLLKNYVDGRIVYYCYNTAILFTYCMFSHPCHLIILIFAASIYGNSPFCSGFSTGSWYVFCLKFYRIFQNTVHKSYLSLFLFSVRVYATDFVDEHYYCL